jgi:lysozyme
MSDPLDQIARQLIRDEGSKVRDGRHMPYLDTVGKWTLGYGRNITDCGISEDEARLLLENDIVGCIGELVATFPWFAKLDDARQAAMVNLCFNLGLSKLRTFHRTLDAMRSGDYESAAYALLQSKYATQVGARAKRVSEQIRTGAWV